MLQRVSSWFASVWSYGMPTFSIFPIFILLSLYCSQIAPKIHHTFFGSIYQCNLTGTPPLKAITNTCLSALNFCCPRPAVLFQNLFISSEQFRDVLLNRLERQQVCLEKKPFFLRYIRWIFYFWPIYYFVFRKNRLKKLDGTVLVRRKKAEGLVK